MQNSENENADPVGAADPVEVSDAQPLLTLMVMRKLVATLETYSS